MKVLIVDDEKVIRKILDDFIRIIKNCSRRTTV